MDKILSLLFCGLQITLIDIVLSGDNIGAIALAIRKLPKKQAKIANIIGVCGAVFMRIIFASAISAIIAVEWLPIKLIGGILLLNITWDLLHVKDTNDYRLLKAPKGFWRAVYNIIMADMSMSLDNVLAIGGVAKGNVWLVVFGLLINIPIIFFGSQLALRLIDNHKITVYIGAGILVHTALEMMLEDRLISSFFSPMFIAIFPWSAALGVVLYGLFAVGYDVKR